MSEDDTAAAPSGPRRPGPRRTAKQGQTYGFSTLFKDSFIYGSGRALQRMLNMLLLPLYTQFLSPADFGLLAMVTTFTLFVDVLITLGWDVTVARFYFDDHDELHRRKVITQTFYVDTVYPVVLLGVLASLMPAIDQRLAGGEDGTAILFDLGIMSLFFINITDIPMQLFRLDHKPMRFAAFSLLRVFVQVPINIVMVAVLDQGVKGILVGNLVASVVIFLAALPFWVRRLHFSWEPRLFKAMFAFATANFTAMLIFYALNYSDRYIINHFEGLSEVGVYQAAYQLSLPVYFVGYAFRLAWPQWHYSFLKDPAQHKLRVARGYTYFTTLTAGLIVLVGVFLPVLIRVLLRRPEYWTVGSIVLVLLASRAFFNSYHLFLVGVNVKKKNRGVPILVGIAAAISIGLNWVVVPRYGAMGAAVVSAVSFCLLAAMMRQLAQHYYPIPHEWRRVLKLVVATVGTIAAAYGILAATGFEISMPMPELVWRQVVAALALALFPLSLWGMRFLAPGEGPALRRLPRSLLPKRRGTPVAGRDQTGLDGPPADTVEADLAGGTADEDELAREEERMEDAWETGLPRNEGQSV